MSIHPRATLRGLEEIRITPKKGSSSGVPGNNCIKGTSDGHTLLRKALARKKLAAKGVVPPVQSLATRPHLTKDVAVEFDPKQLVRQFGQALEEAGYSKCSKSHGRSTAKCLVVTATNVLTCPPSGVDALLNQDILKHWIREVRNSRSAEHRLPLVPLLVTYLHSGQIVKRTMIPQCEWVRSECMTQPSLQRRRAYYEVTYDETKDHPMVREFIEHLFDQNEHWQKGAKYVFRQLCGWLCKQPDFHGDSPITIDFRRVTTTHLHLYRDELEGMVNASHLCKGTFRLHVQRVKRLFGYLYLNGQIKDDPSARLAVVKGREFAPGRLIKPGEVEHLLRAVVLHGDHPLRDLALLGVLSGMGLRPAEAVGLTIGDVDLKVAILRVLGKNKKVRVLPIPGPIVLTLERYLASRPVGLSPEAPLWIGRFGQRLSYGQCLMLFHKYEQNAGVQQVQGRGPHGFRHYFITVNLLAGKDPEDIAALVGHSNLRALASYFHVSVDGLRAALLKAFGLCEEVSS